MARQKRREDGPCEYKKMGVTRPLGMETNILALSKLKREFRESAGAGGGWSIYLKVPRETHEL